MLKVEIKIPKIKLKKLTVREIDEAAKVLLDDLRNTVPVETGQLKRGIRKRRAARGVEFYIQGRRNNEVAGYLIEGTEGHEVKPRRRRALHWTDAGGRSMFSMGHWVRGIKKGYWKFYPRARAIQQFMKRINTLLKAKR